MTDWVPARATTRWADIPAPAWHVLGEGLRALRCLRGFLARSFH